MCPAQKSRWEPEVYWIGRTAPLAPYRRPLGDGAGSHPTECRQPTHQCACSNVTRKTLTIDIQYDEHNAQTCAASGGGGSFFRHSHYCGGHLLRAFASLYGHRVWNRKASISGTRTCGADRLRMGRMGILAPSANDCFSAPVQVWSQILDGYCRHTRRHYFIDRDLASNDGAHPCRPSILGINALFGTAGHEPQK